MHPMNLACICHTLHSMQPPPPELPKVEDIKIVEVTSKFFNNEGNKSYECTITFRGNIVVKCEIHARLITSLIYSKNFKGRIKGLTPLEKGINKSNYPEYEKIDPEIWVSKLCNII